MSENRDLVSQNKIEFLMLVGRLNPLLCCVKKLKDKTLNAHSDRAAKALAANQLTD